MYNFAKENSQGKYYKRSNQINVVKHNGEKYELKYIQILAESNIQAYSSQNIVNAERKFWDQELSRIKNGPLGTGFSTAPFHWCFVRTNRSIIRNAWICLGITLLFTFILVLVGTMNILLAMYSTFLILCIFACEMAILPLFGWEYDTIQSILCIVVLALMGRFLYLYTFAYIYNTKIKPKERIRSALKLTGPLILNSSIAIVGSAVFIYLCTLLILDKFGTIICFTILYSMFFTLVIYPSFLTLIGPKGNCGDIRKLCSTKKKENKSQPKEEEKEGKKENEEGKENEDDDDDDDDDEVEDEHAVYNSHNEDEKNHNNIEINVNNDDQISEENP